MATNFVQLGSVIDVPEWLSDSAQRVQKEFSKHHHNFILIPSVNPDTLKDKDVKAHSVLLGTITTDVEDATEFCVALAGAIASYSKSAKKDAQDEAMKLMADTVRDIIYDVAKMEGKKNG